MDKATVIPVFNIMCALLQAIKIILLDTEQLFKSYQTKLWPPTPKITTITY